MGLNLTTNMIWETTTNMTWETTKKIISRHKEYRLLVIEPVHLGSNSILKVRFLGHPVHTHDFADVTLYELV